MKFEEIEKNVLLKRQPDQNATLAEVQCYIALRDLYHSFAYKYISKDMASRDKKQIKKAFENAVHAENQHKAAWAQYQENIRQAGELLSKMQKAEDETALALLACECVGKMCGEMAGFEMIKKKLFEWNRN